MRELTDTTSILLKEVRMLRGQFRNSYRNQIAQLEGLALEKPP